MGVEQLQEGENRWGPHVGETQSRAQLVLFDGSGRETGDVLVYGGMRVWFEEPEREGNSVDRPVELSV